MLAGGLLTRSWLHNTHSLPLGPVEKQPSAWYFRSLRTHKIIIFSYHLTLIYLSLHIILWNLIPCPYARIDSVKWWSCQGLKTWKKNCGNKCLTGRCCTNIVVLVSTRTIKFLCFIVKCTQFIVKCTQLIVKCTQLLVKCTQHSESVEIMCFYLQGNISLESLQKLLMHKMYARNNFALIFQETCNGIIQKNVTA
jgi:hypothetical protein